MDDHHGSEQRAEAVQELFRVAGLHESPQMSIGNETGKSARTFSVGLKRCGDGPTGSVSGGSGGSSSSSSSSAAASSDSAVGAGASPGLASGSGCGFAGAPGAGCDGGSMAIAAKTRTAAANTAIQRMCLI